MTKMKFEIELSLEDTFDQAIAQMDRNQLQNAGLKIMQKLATPQDKTKTTRRQPSKGIELSTHKPTTTTATTKTTKDNTRKRWTKEDKTRLDELFRAWNGNITKRRFNMLCKKFKRSRGAIKVQLYFIRERFIKNKGTTKTTKITKTEEPKKQHPKKRKTPKKKYHLTPKLKTWLTRLHEKAKELREADGNKKLYSEYLTEASKSLQKGDANTQQTKQPKKFPQIFPLTEKGLENFKDTIEHIIKNPGNKLRIKDAEITLSIIEDEWNEEVWKQFLNQVQLKQKQILDYFDKDGSFVIEMRDNGEWTLEYR